MDKKLKELRPEFAELIEKVLNDLTELGHEPRIASAYRSPAEQAEKVKKGYSKSTKLGSHTFGYGCDIIHRRIGWKYTDDCATFFKDLRDCCDKHGVGNGGWWKQTNGWKKWNLGWDPAHCFFINPPEEWKKDYGPEI